MYIPQESAAQSKYKRCTSSEATIVLMPAKMSELLAVEIGKGLRKRRSTTAIREEDGSRKKHAPSDKGEEIGDMTERVKTKARGFLTVKAMDEQKARDNSLRVEKARTRPRCVCCGCGKMTGVNHKAECVDCGHWHCAVCILQTQEHLSTSKPH